MSVGNANEAGSVSVSGDPEAGATLTASVSDPDGAASGVGWVWSVGASVSGLFSVVSGATGAEFVVRAADVGKYLRAAATYTDSTHSASGQTASETVGPVGAANSAPEFADSDRDGTADAVTRTITENTTTGNVGLAVTATDADSDALTYSVAESSGPDAAADPAADLDAFNRDFSLDAATGQVSVRAGAAIDYETRSAYIVAYRVTDNKNAAGGNDPAVDDTLVLTIDVTDANEAPRFADSDSDGTADAVTRTVTENTTTGDVGLAVTAADPESGDVLAYSVAVTSEAGAAADLDAFNRDFSLDAATGQVSVKATAAIDYETRSAYKVAYRVTDNKNAAGGNDPAVDDTLVLTIDVTDANEAPRFADSDSDGTADAVTRTVSENTTTGDVGLAVTAADPESDALTYSVAESSGPDAAADPAADLADFNRDFEFDPAAAGQVSVRAAAAIDYETRSRLQGGLSGHRQQERAGADDPAVDDTLVLTVSVGNENEAGSVSVSGDPEAGATLTASVSDPDGAASGVGWVWSVGASPTGPFSVVSGATGAEFVVRAADVGKYLRAAATYTDSTHSASGQTASETVGPVGAANSAPEFADSDRDGTADAVSRTITENTTTGNVGLAVTATDADSDALTYSVAESSGPDAAADPAADLDAFNRDFEFDPAAAGQVRVRAGAAIDYESRSAYIVAYRVTDNKNAAGGNDPAVDDTLVLTIDVTDANEAPRFADSDSDGTADAVSRTVSENTTSGDVGLAVTAADPESGDVLAYSVAVTSEAGAAADLADFNRDFSLDAATGQVSVKATAAIDYETRSAYKVAYRVTDNKNSAGSVDTAVDDTLILTINVTDANEAPRFADSDRDGTADAVSRTVTENTTTGGVGLAVTAADPDSGDVLAYSVAESSGPDAAADPAADLADFNRDFSLDAATGQVSVKATAAIDYETRSAYKVAYRVTDNKNSAGSVDIAVDDTLVLTVSVGNENEAGSVSVSGDPEAGATLTASVSDPDGAASGVGWVWSVGASPTGPFSVVSGATGAEFVVRAADVGKYLRAAATYTDSTHSASGQTASETVGPVGATNSAPRFADSNSDGTADAVTRTITENTTTGDVGLAVTATDADSDALTYSVAESSGPDAAADPAADLDAFNRDFSLDAATGQVSVRAGAAIDYETRSAYIVAYRVTDNKNAAGGNDPAVDDTLVLTIDVTDANEAPRFADSDSDGTADAVTRTVTENTTTGGVGLAVTAADPESGDVLAYSVAVTSEAGAAADLDAFNRDFSLDAATGQVSVKATAAIDYETRSAYKVAYRVTDNKNAAGGNDPAVDDTLVLTIDVTDANEAPRFADSDSDGTADAVTRTVTENTTTGDVGLAVTAADPESDALTYSVAESSGPDAAADPAADLADFNRDFEFDPAAAGQVSVRAAAAIDYETRSAYIVAYRVTDNKNSAGSVDIAVDDTLVLTVSVGNANEAGSVSVSGDPEAGATLTASVSDPDGAASGVGWVWSVGASPTGPFSVVSGATGAEFVVRAADVGKYLRAAATYTDSTHSASGQTASETVGPVGATNSAPASLTPTATGPPTR